MRLLCGLLVAVSLYAQTGFFPVAEVRPGMQGIGKTIFSGNLIEEFKVEILGVLENAGPKQSLILARLAGGPLASTGVMQGMSGSPVYINGRLLGAVAMTFTYSKEPIAAIRPIADLIRAGETGAARRPAARASLADTDLMRGFEPVGSVLAGGSRLVDIATPLSFSGFARGTVERFAPQLRAVGLEPQQGLAGGGRLQPGLGKPSAIQPGSMISVQLLTGDMTVGADGTVTYVDGNRVYAFGHKLMSMGSTDIPFARSEVLALVPNLATSFKISAPREWMGTIHEDRNTGVVGELGRRATMVPISIALTHHPDSASGGVQSKYEMEMVSDSLLSPLLVQMAVSSAVESTERTMGSATLSVRGEIQMQGSTVPIRIANTYSGEVGLPDQASLAAAVPLAYALQNDFDNLRPKSIRIEIDSYEARKQVQIGQVWTSRREVKPGESVDLMMVLSGPQGVESTHKATYRVPAGAKTGTLCFTVADGSTTNTTEYRQFLDTAPRSSAQLIAFLNGLHDNTKAYVRVWRPEASYNVGGYNLPSPPPSVGQILSRMDPAMAPMLAAQGSKVAEFEVGADGMVVSGSKTVQVEITQ
jgi:hypothetical protein